MHQWLFFEQNQVEPGLAVARFMALIGRVAKHPEVFADRLRQGRRALESLERGLAEDAVRRRRRVHRRRHRRSTATSTAPARRAPTSREYPRIVAWLERVEATPGFVNDLAPIPWTDS